MALRGRRRAWGRCRGACGQDAADGRVLNREPVAALERAELGLAPHGEGAAQALDGGRQRRRPLPATTAGITLETFRGVQKDDYKWLAMPNIMRMAEA